MKYIQQEITGEDEIRLIQYRSNLQALDPDQLIEAYNRQARIGVVGVRAQMLYLQAMHEVFINVFGKSPFATKGHAFGIGGLIRLKGGGFVRVKPPQSLRIDIWHKSCCKIIEQ
jgi:hypothetical protein